MVPYLIIRINMYIEFTPSLVSTCPSLLPSLLLVSILSPVYLYIQRSRFFSTGPHRGTWHDVLCLRPGAVEIVQDAGICRAVGAWK